MEAGQGPSTTGAGKPSLLRETAAGAGTGTGTGTGSGRLGSAETGKHERPSGLSPAPSHKPSELTAERGREQGSGAAGAKVGEAGEDAAAGKGKGEVMRGIGEGGCGEKHKPGRGSAVGRGGSRKLGRPASNRAGGAKSFSKMEDS